jgi:preprotein translocase subunit SecA
MLQHEIQRRVPAALEEADGAWKLLAYLEEIQPPIDYPEIFYPSYTLRLLLEELGQSADAGDLMKRLVELARRAIQAENSHILQSTRNMLDRASETLDTQLAERLDALDTFLENFAETGGDESIAQQRRPQEVLDELMSLTKTPFRLPGDLFRTLANDPRQAEQELRNQVNSYLIAISLTRLISTVERRLGESLGIKPTDMQNLNWEDAAIRISDTVEGILNKRENHLLGDDGQIIQDLKNNTQRLEAAVTNTNESVRLLGLIAQSARVTFDPKTHQRVVQMSTRLRFPYLAAETIQDRNPEEVTQDVLLHCEDAQSAMLQVWGGNEYLRMSQSGITPAMLDERFRQAIIEKVGQDRFNSIAPTPLAEQDVELRGAIVPIIGKRVQNEVYRQILLGSISELWVDYLTQVEALRVSIGLEAYAQRDPLVQYKGKASEMFQNLLADIRSSVVSRMFVYRPRTSAPTQMSTDTQQPVKMAVPQPVGQSSGTAKHKKKRRRH